MYIEHNAPDWSVSKNPISRIRDVTCFVASFVHSRLSGAETADQVRH